MDNMTFNYTGGTNKLTHVDDAVASGNYNTDIDDQSAYNYTYDKIGNLVKDVQENIDTILWTVYGKVWKVKKSNGDSLIFVYDASGNRVQKIVKRSGQTDKTATITYYIREAAGNILSIYTRDTSGANWVYKQKESDIYGSERIGIFKPSLTVRTRDTLGTTPGSCISCTDKYWWTVNTNNLKGLYTRSIIKKEYELKDHLGNIRATVSDRKNADSTASILSYTHYYAFGTELTGKVYNANSYAYAYNGKLKDDEVFNTSGGFYDYGERGMDARGVPIFLTEDPITREYPELTPYQFASNTPIQAVDLDGLEEYYAADGKLIGKIGDNIQVRVVDDKNVEALRVYIIWANNTISDENKQYAIFKANLLSTNTGLTSNELSSTERLDNSIQHKKKFIERNNNTIKAIDKKIKKLEDDFKIYSESMEAGADGDVVDDGVTFAIIFERMRTNREINQLNENKSILGTVNKKLKNIIDFLTINKEKIIKKEKQESKPEQ